MRSRFAAVAVILACAGAACGQATWTNPAGGAWNLASNWSTGNVPDTIVESAALGDLGAPYSAHFNLSASILGCQIHSSNTLLIDAGRTLTVGSDGLFNDGAIIVNADGLFNNTYIRSGDAFSILGAGRIELNAITADLSDASIDASDLLPITIGADQRVHGSGVIDGPMVLNGTIEADRDGRDLLLTGAHDLTGGGVIRGTNNGRVVIVGRVSGGTVDGGVEASGGAASLGDAITNGTNGVRAGSTLLIDGSGLTNHGTWVVNTAGVFNDAVIRAANDVSITGGGNIELNAVTADLNDARIEGQPGAILTIGASQSVIGSGRVNGPIVLHGTIDADRAGRDLVVAGSINASGDGTLVGSGGTVSLQGAYTGGAMAGGVEAQTGSASISGTTASGANGVRAGSTLSILGGGLTNHGTITVNTTANFNDARLVAIENATLDGAGAIDLNAQTADLNDARLETGAGVVLNVGSEQHITGSGVVNGTFVLDGVIDANRPARDIIVLGSIDMSGGGTMTGNNGGAVSLRASTTGGHLAGGVEAQTANSSIDGAHLSGANGIRSGSTLSVQAGGFSNDGLFTINTTGNFNDSVLHFADSCVIDGVGVIDFNAVTADLNDARASVAGGAVVSVGPGLSLTGSGVIRGDLGLQGSIIANRSGRDLIVEANVDMTGGGSMGGTDGGKVSARGAASNGSWLGGVEAETANASISQVTLSGENGVRTGSRLTIHGDGFANNGTLVINTTQNFSDAIIEASGAQNISGFGVLHLNGATGDLLDATIRTDAAGELTIGQGQTVTGRGTLSGLIHLPGAIAPGDDGDQTDQIRMTGTIDLSATSTVRIDIAGGATALYDQILGTALLTLGGTLEIDLLDDFTPAFEQRFTIIDVGTLAGQFETVISPVDGLGVFRIVQTADKIEAVWTCQADLNGDGNLDFFDVQFFLNVFANEALYGDYNEDGINNFFDVQAFLNDFSAGCL